MTSSMAISTFWPRLVRWRARSARVTLFLLRLTDMKYVDSSPANGGQPRVSSPLPGSSILMTSAPMSPSSIAQYGPARTRVRSRTRIPFSGWSARGTASSFHDPLGQAPRDGVDAVAGVSGAPPEQARALQRPHVREVVDVVDGLAGDDGPDAEPARPGAVTHEAGAAFELDDGDVQRRAEALGRRVQRREREDLTDTAHARRRHRNRVPRTPRGGRRHHRVAPRAPARGDGLDHGLASNGGDSIPGSPRLSAAARTAITAQPLRS